MAVLKLTVFLVGLMAKDRSFLDYISLGVGIMGLYITVQNTTLTVMTYMEFTDGVMFMIATLLVVYVCGTIKPRKIF